MSLVKSQQVPIPGFLLIIIKQIRHVLQRLICRHTDIKRARFHLFSNDTISILFISQQIDYSKLWSPDPKFLHPVRDGTLRTDNHVRSVLRLPSLVKIADERNGHDRLSHAHLIS